VTAKYKNAGETVTMMPPTNVIAVQDLSTIEVKAKLPESALRRVSQSDPMRVRFPSLDKTVEMAVTRINPSVDPKQRTVEVVGTIENPDGELKAGMLVEVSFPKTEKLASSRTDSETPAPVNTTASTTEPKAPKAL
jgi:multidrug efflux pump subunit AcrA (membrane-fusion protein)